MDDLTNHATTVGQIIGISDPPPEVKVEHALDDDSVNVKVLWSSEASGFTGYEVIREGVAEGVKLQSNTPSPVVDPSMVVEGIGHHGDSLLSNEEDLSAVPELAHQPVPENTILNSDDITEGHMLHVPENAGAILADGPTSIQVATSLASELTATSDQDVIQLLLPSDESQDQTAQLQSMGMNLCSTSIANPVITPPTQTVQAITLADGTTAFIQHPNGKFLEGQTITLEDGTTAVVQGLPNKLSTVSLVTTVAPTSTVKQEIGIPHTTVQSVQLEDGTTGLLNQTIKDGLQAIILEDGTTAYLATQTPPPVTTTYLTTHQTSLAAPQALMEPSQLEATTLTLDQFTSPINGVQALLPNGMVNVKTLTIPNHTLITNGVDQQQQQQQQQSQQTTGLKMVTSPSSAEKAAQFVEKAYKCSYDGCGRFYTTPHHLRVHERSHTGDRPFRCEFNGCGKAFATGYGLKSHTRVHTGEKPYKCPEEACDKAFKTSGDLQKHVRTHTGERPFKCPFEGCTRSFTTSNIRKVHIRTHTGERPYLCPEEGCGRAFASATNYKNHIRIHTGEKPYVCTVQGCGKRFTEYSSLYKHHVVHTHSKPYTCNRCGKNYRQTSTLAMHKRTTHGEDVTAESEAILFQEQTLTEDLEPPDKRARLSFSLTQEELQEEGEGTLIINTSDTGQLTLVGSETLNVGSADGLQTSPLSSHTSLLQQAGVATFTLGDHGQQVYVITDPAQLEALQQIAQHQLDTENLDNSLITSLSSEVACLESGDVTVTEITQPTNGISEVTQPTNEISEITHITDISQSTNVITDISQSTNVITDISHSANEITDISQSSTNVITEISPTTNEIVDSTVQLTSTSISDIHTFQSVT